MAQAARAIASGDFGQRIPFQGRNEIGRLAASFNAMAQAVETRRQAEQAAQAEQLRLQENIIQLQEATLKELAVPLITLADHVLLLPLIGTIDQRRSQQLITTLLAGVAQHRASQVILDMTGVTHMDEWSAANLGQLVQGCRLLGAEVALAGLRPHVANMLATTAIATSDITIFSSLHTATEALLKTE
jgi:anti-anti-sigma factor